MMPSTSELTRLRADVEAYTLPDTCHILSLTQTSDGMGGFTDTWGTALSNVFCRLDNIIQDTSIGIEKTTAASIKPYSRWVLTVPHGTTITSANQVEHGSYTYNVLEVDAGRSWGANVRATLERI